MNNFDVLKLAVEAKSGGKNTVILDDVGMPSIMVRIPKFKNHEVGVGVYTADKYDWHPMFLINGELYDEVFIGKYQGIIENDRAYSLPFRDPAVYPNADRARQVCQNKGRGWHLTSNAEYAGIALWCKANGFFPHGNNFCGCDLNNKHEKGVQSFDWLLDYNWQNMANSKVGSTFHHTGRVFTGSGPVTWAHDGTADGIYDLNGNVWEWASGLRLSEGEIQVIPDNNAAAGVDQSPTSSLWKAILPNGTLVAPGAAGTLKYDASIAGGSGAPILSNAVTNRGTEATSTHTPLESLTVKNGVVVPDLAKALGLFPIDTTAGGHDGDGLWMRNNGERLPLRGGTWSLTSASGVSALGLGDLRSISSGGVSLRPAFVNLR